MAFLLVSCFVSFIISISFAWPIQHYKKRYGRNEKMASGVIGFSFFLICLTMFFNDVLAAGKLSDKVASVIFIFEVLCSSAVVYSLLKD